MLNRHREEMKIVHTSDIPNAGTAKDTDDLAGRTTIVTDGDDIGQGAIVLLDDLVEDIDQAVGCRATTEHDDFPC